MGITVEAYGNMPVNDTGTITAAAGASGKTVDKDAAKARKISQDFEALFVGMMLKSMRETVGKDKLTNGGHGEDVYRPLLDQEYAKSLVEHGGIGLTAMLERHLGYPAPDGMRGAGHKDHDTTTTSDKTEVNHENR